LSWISARTALMLLKRLPADAFGLLKIAVAGQMPGEPNHQ
jgi:hypothetical protein